MRKSIDKNQQNRYLHYLNFHAYVAFLRLSTNTKNMLSHPIKILFFNKLLDIFRNLWNIIGDYTGFGKSANIGKIDDLDDLKSFINSRSSHIAQSALYGYLKTRAGTRFPEMFANPDLLTSMNIAKWQIWLSCVSDLSVYMGGLVCSQSDAKSTQVATCLVNIVDSLFIESEYVEQQKKEFEDNKRLVRTRLNNTDYTAVTDDEMAFSTSPAALYQWAPIAAELKRFDKEIVENSIRFRWQEIRRTARKKLNAKALALHF